ncbi:hypothetical protein HH310_16955 [Actinoplanes sp. TBRC 11911]|uniref:hypothetical protein n=1 Tax=Actinoplanes sp. TBRC 11911 TaxID=2729386 RepID=UPI00145CDFC9|nr:hypothetical protein [Actinoplanes sp. TBRC 11911]NMO52874.1 hypothetical protein [Actinoplanes sp. TBRC 11911]
MTSARATRYTCAAALACGAGAAAASLTPAPHLLRAPIVLVFCCWVPGVALFAAMRAWRLVRSPAATITTSLSLLILVSQGALVAHLWAPEQATAVLAAASCAVLAGAVVMLRERA